jgi:AhpC/TSA family
MIERGDPAPEFELPDQDGRAVKLSDLRGRHVVVYFHPKADTPVRKCSNSPQGNPHRLLVAGQGQGQRSALGRALGAGGVAAVVAALGGLAAGPGRQLSTNRRSRSPHTSSDMSISEQSGFAR